MDDVLVLNDPDACEPEIVTYYAQVIIPGMICEGKTDTFRVTVYPLPRIPEQTKTGILPLKFLRTGYHCRMWLPW